MKIPVLILFFCIFLIVPQVLALECEFQEIHECREVSEEMHAFNGQIDTDCVERGVYDICTAFNHLDAEGSCYIDENSTASCSCTPDIGLFCSSDNLAIVTSNSDCTTRNELCVNSLYCSDNDDAPYNPFCGTTPPPSNGGNIGGGFSGGSSGGGTTGGSGADDYPTTDEDIINEPTGTITDIIEDFTEDISNPESPTLMIVIIIMIVIIVAVAGTLYYLKKHKKKKYKGY